MKPKNLTRRLLTAAALAAMPLLLGAKGGCGGDDVSLGDDGNKNGVQCGSNTCAEGEVCCNESCGICTKPGEGCIELFCQGDGGKLPPYDPCDGKSCGDPCSPCAPGDQDCSAPAVEMFCNDQGKCGAHDSKCGSGGGEVCGDVVCGDGEWCCNESCSMCAPEGEGCIEIACFPGCDPMDARTGAPDCALLVGVAWDGSSCHEILCTCEGTDCDVLYPDRASCESATSQCSGTAPRDPISGGCARNVGHSCATDADCATGGCGGEVCFNPSIEDVASTCDCVAPQATGCGCVEGQCTWYK